MERHIWETRIAIKGRLPTDHLHAVKEVLNSPHVVSRSAIQPNREYFYRKGALPPPQHNAYLKIVVDYSRHPLTGSQTGSVVAGYASNKIGQRERRIWP